MRNFDKAGVNNTNRLQTANYTCLDRSSDQPDRNMLSWGRGGVGGGGGAWGGGWGGTLRKSYA